MLNGSIGFIEYRDVMEYCSCRGAQVSPGMKMPSLIRIVTVSWSCYGRHAGNNMREMV